MTDLLQPDSCPNLLQNIIEGVPMRIFWKDRNSRYLGCNTLFARDAGFARPEELIGKTDFDMDWKDHAHSYRADDASVMKSGLPKYDYSTDRSVRGDNISIRVSKMPLWSAEQKIIGVLGVYEDMTAQDLRQADAARLLESEEKFHSIFENLSEGIIMRLGDGKIYAANDSALKILGCTLEELTTLHMPWPTIHEDGTPFLQEDYPGTKAINFGTIYHNIVMGLMHPDGSATWVSMNAVPLFHADAHRPYAAITTFNDITEQKQNEQALAKATRALRTLSACNHALVRATNERELLDSICRLTVESGNYLMAWIGFAENDPEKSVRRVAQCGFDEGYTAQTHVSWADTERGRGPAGLAIRTGVAQVCDDFLTDPNLAPWREEAVKRGYRSSIALPLKNYQGILGMMGIYAPEPKAFSEDCVKLFQELANNLAFGIGALRIRNESQRAA
ncbi:MAG: GAF domain-containing protein [Alphaproteobacteria bacterium]